MAARQRKIARLLRAFFRLHPGDVSPTPSNRGHTKAHTVGFVMEMKMEQSTETLRSGVTPDGQKVFLLFDGDKRLYRVATRWVWLAKFNSIWDACDAFEVIEMMEGDLRKVARICSAEIVRVPRTKSAGPIGMGRINYLINSTERRCAGLRPILTGSKGSVERWIPARAAIAKATNF